MFQDIIIIEYGCAAEMSKLTKSLSPDVSKQVCLVQSQTDVTLL